MVESTPGPGSPRPIEPQGAPKERAGAPRHAGDRGGAAFQALLEKLQTQASRLERDAERVAGPEDLAGAVERAESSMRDALALQEQLLEAYRQAVRADEIAPGGGAGEGR